MTNNARHIAILGAGNMGAALGHALALNGARVALSDFFREAVAGKQPALAQLIQEL